MRYAGRKWASPLVVGMAALTMVWLSCISWVAAQGMGGSPPGGGDSPAIAPKPTFEQRVWEAGGPQFLASENQKLIVDVIVRGNESVREDKIRSYLQTRKDRSFDTEIVQADVRRLMTSGLLRNVRTYTDDVEGGVLVTFEVFEHPTIRYVKYIGNRGLTDRTLAKQTDLKMGQPINAYTVEEARNTIETFYKTKGFPNTKVSILEGNRPGDKGIQFVISEGELQRIADVDFIGNKFVSDGRLKTQVQSKPGVLWYLFRGRVDRDKIDEDVQRLTAYYRSFGFFRAEISREMDFDSSGRWLNLTFVVNEGPRYQVRSVSVIGNERLASDSLVEQLTLKPGDFFNLASMTRDKTTLLDVYGSQGHIYANVEASPRFLEEPGQLDLVYNIEEGDQFRIGRVRVLIEGDYPHTRERVVWTRMSEIKPGSIANLAAIRNAERRLKASQLFENDPARGIEPHIIFRTPEIFDELMPERPPLDTYRGQSP